LHGHLLQLRKSLLGLAKSLPDKIWQNVPASQEISTKRKSKIQFASQSKLPGDRVCLMPIQLLILLSNLGNINKPAEVDPLVIHAMAAKRESKQFGLERFEVCAQDGNVNSFIPCLFELKRKNIWARHAPMNVYKR